MQATTAPAQADTTQRLAAFVRYVMTTCGRDFLQALDDLELSLSQVKLLNVLSDAGEVPLKEAGDHLALSLPAVSRAVDGLVQRGLVKRTEDPDDRRMKRVALSAKGRRLAQDLVQLRFAGLDEFVAGLDPRERGALDKALELLSRREEIG
ncbi:MAG: MarR family transcriptional regulator [Thermoleophilaceae bacterium]